MAKAHSFEGVFIMAGSVVNQDGRLGHVFATPGVEDVSAIVFNTFCCDTSPLTLPCSSSQTAATQMITKLSGTLRPTSSKYIILSYSWARHDDAFIVIKLRL